MLDSTTLILVALGGGAVLFTLLFLMMGSRNDAPVAGNNRPGRHV